MTRPGENIRADAARRLLMISAAFPPIGGPGVQRSAKFAKYLPQFGWQPTVWRIDRMKGLPSDPTLCTDLPADLEIITQSSSALSNWKFPRAIARRADAWRTQPALPDDYAPWVKTSMAPLQRLVGERAFDAIYSTFSPASNHLLALRIKEWTGLPWVADFRDLWTDDYRYLETSPARRSAHRLLEQRILETADKVVGVSAGQTAVLANHLPMHQRKFVTVTNGFDPADFPAVPAPDRAGRFVLAHVGRLDQWRTGTALYAGLGQFADALGPDREAVEFRIVGHADSRTLERTASTGLPYSFGAYVSHSEAIKEMRAADALLLALPGGHNAHTVIAAKLFEYLAAQRPILVVGPAGGECEQIVRECHAGITVPFDDRTIAGALEQLYWARRSGRPISGCGAADSERYSRVALTGKLAAVLNELVGVDAPNAVSAGALREANCCTV